MGLFASCCFFCGSCKHVVALHPRMLLSGNNPYQIGSIILYVFLPHCTLDRCTPMVLPSYESVHVCTTPPLSWDTCCIWDTERQGYERGPTVELKSHLFSFFLLLGRASPHPLCFDVLEESWRGQTKEHKIHVP